MEAPKLNPSSRPILGITLGDAAGIGPEVMLEAMASWKDSLRCELRLVGAAPSVQPGIPGILTAQAAWDALEKSVDLLKSGQIDGVVTGPIHKASLHQVGFVWPGHTEFFAERFANQMDGEPVMLLSGGPLTVALVTAHCAFEEVISGLTVDRICRTARELKKFLQKLGFTNPRIAVAGLNPHAGEEGAFGSEEIKVIRPAVKLLQSEWGERAVVEGPCVPDAVFREAVEGRWDGIVCMYHDQGLIPLKLLAFDEGVNVTLGLPVVRTSPDHGTAFGLAGKGLARSGSARAAIRLAARLLVGPGES